MHALMSIQSVVTHMQVHYTWPNGRGSVLLGVEPSRPSYARLVELLKAVPNTRASRSWVDRVLDIKNLKGTLPLHPLSTTGHQSSHDPCCVAIHTVCNLRMSMCAHMQCECHKVMPMPTA